MPLAVVRTGTVFSTSTLSKSGVIFLANLPAVCFQRENESLRTVREEFDKQRFDLLRSKLEGESNSRGLEEGYNPS